jgi:collagenase-like PrtC family protease
MIELLAPAGNQENLEAAINAGADAVYLGTTNFNARRRAKNFNNLKQTVDYCHQHGVKVYLTLNTLIKNSELNQFFETLTKAYLSNIDAVIIQHISLINFIKQNYPGLEVHLSTQSAINNSYIQPLIKQADRIILPRELFKEDIDKFKMDKEVFVQGALCFSYSGKCLFSSFLGGRSGNRGMCAQPCRRLYNTKYLLNMKDLCLVNHVQELIKQGVTSIKIEGRLRSAKYVSAAVKLYRKAIDTLKVDKELYNEMKLAFNREFTEGYYVKSKNVVSHDSPKNKGLPITEKDLKIGDGVAIHYNNEITGMIYDGKLPKYDKLYLTSTKTKPKEITFKPKPEIIIKPRTAPKIVLPEFKKQPFNQEMIVKVHSLKDYNIATQFTDKVFYNIFAKDYTTECNAYVPPLLSDNDVEQALKIIKDVKNILVADLGVYAQLKNKNIYLDYSLNIFNDFDLDFFSNAKAIVSPELSYQDKFTNPNYARLVHGKVILMRTKYLNLPKNLQDEKGHVFQVKQEHNHKLILNSVEQGLFQKLDCSYYFDLYDNVEKTLTTYKKIFNNEFVKINTKGYTLGHFKKSVL